MPIDHDRPMILNTAPLFLLLLEVTRPDLVCDVGSCDGAHARRFRWFLRGARIVAFEPHPDNLRDMRENPRNVAARIEIHPAAVWNQDGSVPFHLEHTGTGSEPWRRAISSTRTRVRNSLGATTVDVPAVRLDSFVRGVHPPPNRIALWIDVEGGAYEALQGIAGIAQRIQVIHVEVEDMEYWTGQKLAGEVEALLTGLGFMELARGLSHGQRDTVFVNAEVYRARPLRFRLAALAALGVTQLQRWPATRGLIRGLRRLVWGPVMGE